MAFTDNCSVFGSIHEDGFNAIFGHLQRQRPSLFNYATPGIAASKYMLCHPIIVHPVIDKPNRLNPHFTVQDYLSIPGPDATFDFGIEYVIQLSNLKIDFAPGNIINLPQELAPLSLQKFGIQFRVCGGIGCGDKERLQQLIPPPPRPDDGKGRPNDKQDDSPRPDKKVIPIPFKGIDCFCLDVYAVGGVNLTEFWGFPYVNLSVDNVEIVNIEPEKLENSLECLILMLLRLSILPKTRILLKDYIFNLPMNLGAITMKPTPTSGFIPRNPSIEDDQLKVFVDLSAV